MTVPFTLSGIAATIFLKGVPNTVDASHPSFQEIVDRLKSGDYTVDLLQGLVNVKATIQQAVKAHGKVTVTTDAVLYDGAPVHSHLTTRMLDMLRQDFNVDPWVAFMEKLYQNPSMTAVDELFLWLEQSGMPITEDGDFLAYKKVRDDYSSYHKNKDGTPFWNFVGATVEMPRNQVDDRRDRTCSEGLHFCSWQYLPHYYGSQGKVLVVKINPADVVSIPSDYDNAKGRAAKYTIVSEIEEEQARFAFEGMAVADGYDDYSEDDAFDL